MKPHPRIRKTIKWGGAAVTVLLVAVWIGSGYWGVSYRKDHWAVGGGNGVVRLSHYTEFGMTYAGSEGFDWSSRGENPGWKLWFEGRVTGGRVANYLDVPFWALALASLSATGAAWFLDLRARRRDRSNLCPKCNYDRAGIAVGAKCPECGRLPS